MLAAFSLVVASLVGGLVSMVHGGESDEQHAEHYMFARISLQALAVVLMAVLAYMLYNQ